MQHNTQVIREEIKTIDVKINDLAAHADNILRQESNLVLRAELEKITKELETMSRMRDALLVKEETLVKDILAVKVPADIRPSWMSKVFTGNRKGMIERGIEDVRRITAPELIKDPQLVVKASRGTRSFALRDSINMTKHANKTVARHEIGHWIENQNEHVHSRCVEFWEKRTWGEKSEWLGDRFGRREITKKDKFFNPYAGKIYVDATGRQYATEILSMGMQNLLLDPVGFLGYDQEYFRFVVGILRGEI